MNKFIKVHHNVGAPADRQIETAYVNISDIYMVTDQGALGRSILSIHASGLNCVSETIEEIIALING